jgi:plasmid stabilization system protein ParE
MVETVIWSEEALGDIDAIAEYIARDSEYHAIRVVDQMLELGEALVHLTKSGRVVPELQNEAIREKFLYSYRLIYQIEAEAIHIIAVIHGKCLLEAVEDRLAGRT